LKDSLKLQNFVRNDDIRLAILQAMLPAEGSQTPPPVTPLLNSLIVTHTSPLDLAAVSSSHFSAILFSHLVRSSSRAKAIARAIMPSPASITSSASGGGNFFVPADGAPPPAAAEAEDDDEDEAQSLIQIICENLSLAFLARSRVDTSDREAREWNRLVVAYLSFLSQWLWDDPGSVRAFLDAGGLGVVSLISLFYAN
jgi:intracellular protein transport protein USO1